MTIRVVSTTIQSEWHFRFNKSFDDIIDVANLNEAAAQVWWACSGAPDHGQVVDQKLAEHHLSGSFGTKEPVATPLGKDGHWLYWLASCSQASCLSQICSYLNLNMSGSLPQNEPKLSFKQKFQSLFLYNQAIRKVSSSHMEFRQCLWQQNLCFFGWSNHQVWSMVSHLFQP